MIKNSTQITNPTQAANATQSTSSILPKSTSTIEAAPRMEATPRPDPKRLQRFCKRSVTPTTENTSFQDTSYSLQSFKITNPNSDSPPNAVLLQSRADSSSSSNTLPFDFGSIAVGDNHTTAFSTQNGASSPGKSVNHDASTSALSAGAIVGIVLGSIAFVLLIVILLICLKRRRSKKQRKLKTREMLRAYCGSKDYKGDTLLPSNLQQLHKMTSKDSYSRSAVDIQDMKDILDDARPDIQPLCYTKDAIDYAELPDQELIQLEPDVKGPLYLFNGLYMSSENEQVCRIMDGYVTRTFQSDDGNKHTVHYFSNTHAHTFIRSVYAALRISLPEKTTYTVRSERAIVLGSPTPYSGYRYLWISSPVMPDHSLHHLLFEDNVWSFIDHHSADYKIWSVYAILKSVESVHHQDFVHLAIEPKHFYFDHEMNATDWHLGNFGYAHALSIQQSPSLPIPTSYSAPEIVQADGSSAFLATSSDIWSLGCVIYTIVTGGLVLFNSADQLKELLKTDGMKHHLEKAMQGTIENHVFAKILDMMLCVDPKERKAIDEIIAYWHSVYNMEE
ncbi:kinase-like domain-containing protein [Blakeslea trispora]|nr:kinase-like domain-containing protein [Blakeslea trispora]